MEQITLIFLVLVFNLMVVFYFFIFSIVFILVERRVIKKKEGDKIINDE